VSICAHDSERNRWTYVDTDGRLQNFTCNKLKELSIIAMFPSQSFAASATYLLRILNHYNSLLWKCWSTVVCPISARRKLCWLWPKGARSDSPSCFTGYVWRSCFTLAQTHLSLLSYSPDSTNWVKSPRLHSRF